MNGWLIAFAATANGNPLFWAVHLADEREAIVAVSQAANVDVDTPVVSGPVRSKVIEVFGASPGKVVFVGDIGMPKG